MGSEKTNWDLLNAVSENVNAANNVVDDVEYLYHKMDGLTEDQTMNFMLGLIEKYRLVFNDLQLSTEQAYEILRRGTPYEDTKNKDL